MAELPRISEAEWQVMRVLWARHPLTANQVVGALSDATDWKPKTIKTLLRRLVDKGALEYTQHGRAYLYHPAVKQEQCVRAERRSFVERVYGGALTPMLAAFLREESLSADEIAELKRILDDKGT
jgi:BlaI family penicillinase repressor